MYLPFFFFFFLSRFDRCFLESEEASLLLSSSKYLSESFLLADTWSGTDKFMDMTGISSVGDNNCDEDEGDRRAWLEPLR